MAILKTATINWKPLSKKHKRYIKDAIHNRMCVAEGAIRSGKTIDHCIIAAMYLEYCKDRIHLASGSTIANAKLNIGDCNGFGLEHLFRGRCRWGKYKDNEALYIETKTGEKIVIFAGGGKADSYKRILGNSYGLWIATEINEHYDSDNSRTSFIKVAFGRQVAADKPFVLWDLNPCNPSHKIYKNYIDAYLEDFVGGYLYEHFTIDDNLSITPERKAEIESQYEAGSIWYRRDILGERCIAEGLIYPNYEKAIETAPSGSPADYCLSIDYGTLNAFAAVLWAKYGDIWYAIRRYYYSGRDEGIQKTDSQYADALDDLICDIMAEREKNAGNSVFTGQGIFCKMETIVDPSAASFITELRKRRWYKVIKADNAVIDGIRETNTAIERDLIKIDPSIKEWADEASGYVWDDNEGEERPVKVNDHCLVGDTLVETEHGQMPIKELVGKTGLVWSYNIYTQKAELKPFYDCRMTQEEADIYEIETEHGRIIRCTAEHPILTQRGYVEVKNLSVAEKFFSLTNMEKQKPVPSSAEVSYVGITGIKKVGRASVYNMEVADNHNFAVEGGLIVHNCMDAVRYFTKTKKIAKRYRGR